MTKVTSPRFSLDCHIRAMGIFQGDRADSKHYLKFFGSVSHFAVGHFHHYCEPNPRQYDPEYWLMTYLWFLRGVY